MSSQPLHDEIHFCAHVILMVWDGLRTEKHGQSAQTRKCSSKTRTVFLRHGSCVNSATKQSELFPLSSSLPTTRSTILSPLGSQGRALSTCGIHPWSTSDTKIESFPEVGVCDSHSARLSALTTALSSDLAQSVFDLQRGLVASEGKNQRLPSLSSRLRVSGPLCLGISRL